MHSKKKKNEMSATSLSDAEQEKRARWEAEQNELKAKVKLTDISDEWLDSVKYVAGVDISFFADDESRAVAALVVLDISLSSSCDSNKNDQNMPVVFECMREVRLAEPYIPGFLAFRECPHLLPLFDEIPNQYRPNAVMVDGNGILHPRAFGLASQLGVLSGVPTIGVGKTLMHVDGLREKTVRGQCKQLAPRDWLPLEGVTTKRVYGAALRATAESIRPIFVSIGHNISLESAVALVLRTSAHRVPEPVRQADLRSRDVVRDLLRNDQGRKTI
jgi:endonuclease V